MTTSDSPRGAGGACKARYFEFDSQWHLFLQPGSEELTIDHVVPRAQGGQSAWTNCVLACIDCNSKKADRTPAQAHMKLRKEPVRPAWKPIFSRLEAVGLRL